MKTKIFTKKGFTLIELLVVVLIIGILAAIAVPQYQKAVAKSKFATLKNNVKAIYEAEKAYHLAIGSYTTNLNNLDITITANNCYVAFGGEAAGYYAFCNTSIAGGSISYLMWFDSYTQPSCVAGSGSDRNHIVHQICKDETGRTSPSNCNDYGGCNYHPN